MAKKKESKQKKMNVRVDFTPMVDMMMLLITFFMLCTSLAKPQAMQLTMPSKDKATDEQKDKAKTDRLVTIYLAPDNKLYTYIIDKKELFGELEDGDKKLLEEVTYGVGEREPGEPRSLRDVLRTYKPKDDNGRTVDVPPVQAILNATEYLKDWKSNQVPGVVTDSIFDKAYNMITKGYLKVVDQNGLNEALYKKILEAQLNKTEDPNELGMDITLAVNIKPMDNCTYDNLVNVLDEMAINCIGSYRISEVNEQDLVLLSKIGLAEAPATEAAE